MSEFKDYTLDELFTHPMGKGSFSNTGLIVSNLRKRFSKLYNAREKDFSHKVFSKGDTYFIWFKIPSEVVEIDVKYDILFKLIPKNKSDRLSDNVGDYNIKVFSNNPGFTYAFAYVFNDNDKLIKKLRNRYHRKVLKNEPDIRNRQKNMGFDKSLYFAYFYMTRKALNNKSILERGRIKKATKRTLFKHIADADTKTAKRRKEDKERRKKKRREKKKQKKKSRKSRNTVNTYRKSKNRITGKRKITGKKKITPKKKI